MPTNRFARRRLSGPVPVATENSGQGAEKAGAIHDPDLLSLASDQFLRRLVITGRPDLGMPDFAGASGREPDFQPLSSQEIADLVEPARLLETSSPHCKRHRQAQGQERRVLLKTDSKGRRKWKIILTATRRRPTPLPPRRTFFWWLTYGLGAAAAAVVGLPFLGFAFGTQKRKVEWVDLGSVREFPRSAKPGWSRSIIRSKRRGTE